MILGNSSRIDDRDATKFHFDASGVTVVRGENSRLECPVFAYPRPDIRWKAPNGKDITSQVFVALHAKYFDGNVF